MSSDSVAVGVGVSMISDFLLPLLGVVIILFCILSFFLPYGAKFTGRTQKIKAFGLNMEVSVLTLFVIIGVVLSLTGIYLQTKDYEGQLGTFEGQMARITLERDLAREDVAKAKLMNIKVIIDLEGISDDNMPRLEDVRCRYFLYGEENPVEVDVTRGYGPHQLKITLKDITAKAHIRQLVLEDPPTSRIWVKENFMPFEPTYNLKRSDS